MERRHPLLTIRTRQHVWLGVLGITLVAVCATSFPILVGVLLYSGSIYSALVTCALASAFPIFIAPPIAWFGLNVARLLTRTIDRVDEIVRYDAVTGLSSRAYLLGRFRELSDEDGVFLMIDADHFKSINDRHGHDVGDEALKRLADILRATTPKGALVGRLGGEEFGMFLPRASETEAVAAAARICEATRRDGAEVVGLRLDMTVSVGVALHQSDASIDATIKLADRALYAAKNAGRDRFFLAEPTSSDELADRSPKLVDRRWRSS